MNGKILEIRLEKFAFGGDAIGHLPDGRAAFVPFALPGEYATIRVLEEHRKHVRAEVVTLLEASSQRIVPKCPHFGQCGGCHYQHMPYETQLDGKVSMLGEQLTRLGRIETPPLQSIIPCPHPWNYRNHVQFHLNAAGRLGYMEAKGRKIFEIDQCHLPEPELATLWPGLQFEAGLGLERISLRLGRDGEAMLVLESPEPPELEIESGLSVVHLLNDEAIVMAGDDHLFMQVFDRFFKVSAGSFFQVNTPMAGRMVAHLLDRLPLAPQVTLLEVYCGVGLFSAFLAGRVGRLVGIEVSPSACSDFEVNLDEFDNVELYQASAGEVLPNLALKPEIILVDPPRAGLEKGVLDGILALRPQCLAYISCDPATLARDAARLLAAGYQLAEVTPFDLFPQTCHIESISIFRSKETK